MPKLRAIRQLDVGFPVGDNLRRDAYLLSCVFAASRTLHRKERGLALSLRRDCERAEAREGYCC
jgi:hypothetical protein